MIPPSRFRRTLPLCALLLALTALGGCAGHAARSQELLATEYQNLADDALVLYYHELSDQIIAVEQGHRGSSVSFGFGLGSFGSRSSTSAGVGVTTGVGGANVVATDLRDQRTKVFLELQLRGISP